MTMRTLFKDLKVGQSLSIDGGRIVITLEEKSGQRAKLKFVHDGVTIQREGESPPAPAPRKRSTGAAQAMMGTKLAA